MTRNFFGGPTTSPASFDPATEPAWLGFRAKRVQGGSFRLGVLKVLVYESLVPSRLYKGWLKGPR